MKHRGLIWLRNAFLVLLLAFICIGGTLLAVSSVADPALFHSVVDPVGEFLSNTADDVAGWIRETVDGLVEDLRSLAAPPPVIAAGETPNVEALGSDAQIAGAPTIRSDFVFADPTITELVIEEDGVEYLLGGNMKLPYFNQGDEEWASLPFGADPIGPYGCGPTALAMAVSALTGEYIDPGEMAAWTAARGQSAYHSGSYLSIASVTAEGFGLDCVSLADIDAEGLVQTLSGGGVIFALMGPGHFTDGGHFILLHGVTLTGEILTADPNSRENSLTTWDPELILSETSQSRYAGAPLWLLTEPSPLSEDSSEESSGSSDNRPIL